jgi:hypothetical protein
VVAINFIQYPLNHCTAGTAVEVTLQGVESDVFLVDSSNFSSFKRSASYTRYGGRTKKSPVTLVVPSSGTWTAVVIPGGVGQRVRATFRVLSAA